MKFRENKNVRGFYEGKKGDFEFTISTSKNGWYIVASHLKKDIRFNTLWINKEFDTKEIAQEFCETFDYKKYDCIGDDVNCA